MSNDLEQWCTKFENNDDSLMAELFADGFSYEEIADKWECCVETVRTKVIKFMPSTEELATYKRKCVRKKLNARARNS